MKKTIRRPRGRKDYNSHLNFHCIAIGHKYLASFDPKKYIVISNTFSDSAVSFCIFFC